MDPIYLNFSNPFVCSSQTVVVNINVAYVDEDTSSKKNMTSQYMPLERVSRLIAEKQYISASYLWFTFMVAISELWTSKMLYSLSLVLHLFFYIYFF